jgi:hypothetical protein
MQTQQTHMKMRLSSIVGGAVALTTLLSLTAAPVRAQAAENPQSRSDVLPCSPLAVNPADRSDVFGNPEVAGQYGIVRGPDRTVARGLPRRERRAFHYSTPTEDS